MTSLVLENGNHVIAENGSLILKRVEETDEGHLSCIASNGIAPDLVKKVTLTIGSKCWDLNS